MKGSTEPTGCAPSHNGTRGVRGVCWTALRQRARSWGLNDTLLGGFGLLEVRVQLVFEMQLLFLQDFDLNG